MGTQITALCECGLNEDVRVGGGFSDFTTVCDFPCLCEGCHSLVQANLLSKSLKCPKCRSGGLIPYDDPRLLDATGDQIIADWNMQAELGRVLTLTNGSYKCPKCGEMTLTFSDQNAVFFD